MNFKYLLAIVAVAAFFVLFGYFQAMPSLPSGENNFQGPKITVEPKVYDFGDIKFGAIVEHRFKVENIGDKTLEIKRLSTSCACTKARIDKEKLEPGEKTELLVTYDPATMGRKIIGKRVARFIYLKSNDLTNPQEEVTIYGRAQ